MDKFRSKWSVCRRQSNDHFWQIVQKSQRTNSFMLAPTQSRCRGLKETKSVSACIHSSSIRMGVSLSKAIRWRRLTQSLFALLQTIASFSPRLNSWISMTTPMILLSHPFLLIRKVGSWRRSAKFQPVGHSPVRSTSIAREACWSVPITSVALLSYSRLALMAALHLGISSNSKSHLEVTGQKKDKRNLIRIISSLQVMIMSFHQT